MNRSILFISLALAATALPGAAHAQAQASFDSTGWTLLGEETVDGPRDKDVIEVGRREGRFEKLAMVVLDDDLSLTSMTITFTNGETQAPAMKQIFREGARSRAVDLTGEPRGIAKIELVYGNIEARDHRGKGKRARWRGVRDQSKARVQLWGLEAKKPAWKPDGWELVAEKKVTAKKGSTTLTIKRKDVVYDEIGLVVSDGDLTITNVQVAYRKGAKGSHKLGHSFRGSERHRGVEADRSRPIKSITISYSGRTGGRSTTIQAYGRMKDQVAAPWTFESKGWTLLGEQTVDGKRDRDVIQVGRQEGKFETLAIVVLDADVEMKGMTATTAKGDKLSPKLAHRFEEGQRSREISLPERTALKQIELSYGTTRGGGKARVQVWAR